MLGEGESEVELGRGYLATFACSVITNRPLVGFVKLKVMTKIRCKSGKLDDSFGLFSDQ